MTEDRQLEPAGLLPLWQAESVVHRDAGKADAPPPIPPAAQTPAAIPGYRSFNDVGGDRGNFASQALRAGGWGDDLGWYRSAESWWYNSSNETWSWINVNYWASFAYTHSRRVNQPRQRLEHGHRRRTAGRRHQGRQ
ncbi:amidase domain-containing protein [Micromonospora sp. KC213]|uniref:amidase domain-containing protein n=1 Tax=Micromonospora sp. KC213 TaxID=2530378 RepID=UPI0014044C08|nr:amidase domain-containing protein [Micromonospora sp. KC213]